MSNEIKRRVLLASVLKPVEDTRMLEKIGATLAEQGFDVIIVGYPSDKEVRAPGITTITLPRFNRLSLKRLVIPWTIFRKINQVKPETVIINTPELLMVAVLNRILFRRKLVYDVLENYYRTIRYTDTYPTPFRLLIASAVRLAEVLCAPFVSRFLLAEKGYASELKFAKQPVVLENRLPKKIADRYCPPGERSRFNLLFSGTLARTTGIFDAIRIAKQLHELDSRYTLTIIGYAALPETRAEIQHEIATLGFVKLIGGDKLVAHHDILREMSIAGAGFVLYPPNPGTATSVPTKLYEYLALKLPIIISHTAPSCDLVQKFNAGIVLTSNQDIAKLDHALTRASFTFDCDASVYWDSQSGQLTDAIMR